MQRTIKVYNSILNEFPELTFKQADQFYWSSIDNIVAHKPIQTPTDLWLLLHEIAHFELGHTDYEFDAHLAKYEALAWNHAILALAPRYNLEIDPNIIEDSLDTYRAWLHNRSLCPNCQQTGLQQNKNTYSCLNCRCSWRVNEARLCGLRRKTLDSSLATAAN